MKTFDELIDEFGGAARVAFVGQIHQHTVEAWRKTGIPVKYWKLFMSKSGVTTDNLYQICLKARNAKARKNS